MAVIEVEKIACIVFIRKVGSDEYNIMRAVCGVMLCGRRAVAETPDAWYRVFEPVRDRPFALGGGGGEALAERGQPLGRDF